MRTLRQTAIRRALLHVLSLLPEGVMLPDRLLRADAQRCLPAPAPTTAEIDAELREADTARFITSLPADDDILRHLTTAGRAWLAEHP